MIKLCHAGYVLYINVYYRCLHRFVLVLSNSSLASKGNYPHQIWPPLSLYALWSQTHLARKYSNHLVVSSKRECKKCGTRIGYLEIFSEITTGIIMVLIATTIKVTTADTMDWLIFASLFFLTSTLVLLALYDGAYGELPTAALITATVCSIIYVVLKIMQAELDPVEVIISALILGGLYLALYLVSKGKWVGDGDWILADIIGLALGQPFFALAALFVSNFSACIIMWPYIKKSKNHKIYFGPFLVFGFIITLVISNYVIINLW